MSDRRTFLRGLASLPLIGGSVALIGNPTATAVPVTRDLMESYKSWLFMEQRMLSLELAGYDVKLGREIEHQFMNGTPGDRWHLQWPNPEGRLAGWPNAPQPSTRAAVVLSAVGVSLGEGT